MKIVIYWRKDKGKSINVWYFWSANQKFSCFCISINKRRRPERLFLGFARHRPFDDHEYKEIGKFVVEEREIYNKIK